MDSEELDVFQGYEKALSRSFTGAISVSSVLHAPITVSGIQVFVGLTSRLHSEGDKMKAKTHSGAKKRMRLLSSGKVKRKQCGIRHLLSPHSSKVKRHLGDTAYVHSANMNQTRRLLNF
jgi:large subunit ribosomal protein L35